MTLFGLCHAQKNAFAFFVALSFGKIAVGLSGLDFCLPIAPRDIDGVLMIFLLGSHAELKRKEARLPSRHKIPESATRPLFQSAGSSAALKAGSARARSCCAVIMSATEPMISAAAINVRTVTVSPAKRVPSSTATIGFTYA